MISINGDILSQIVEDGKYVDQMWLNDELIWTQDQEGNGWFYGEGYFEGTAW